MQRIKMPVLTRPTAPFVQGGANQKRAAVSRSNHFRLWAEYNFPLCSLVVISSFFGLISTSVRSQQVILVCPERFDEAVRPWVAMRKVQGMHVSVIRPSQHAKDTKNSIVAAFGQLDAGRITDSDAPSDKVGHDNPRYVFLIGKTPTIGTDCEISKQVPTFYSDSKVSLNWGSTPTIPTDFPFADVDDDGIPDVSVGRLPVENAYQFKSWWSRLKQREQTTDFLDWHTEVQLIGGVGGFGFLADRAIESVARTIVTGVLPTNVRTRVLYGSPGHRFFPTGKSFTDAVVNEFSNGARFWVYAGHGQVTELDRVPPNRDGIPVLDPKSIEQLSCPSAKSPIALLLACYTGALDATEECVAQKLLSADGGPVAVIAGSRVTMPYGNAILAVGLIRSFYTERKSTLGACWLHTQRMMQKDTATVDQSARILIDGLATLISPAGSTLTEERREHLLLYQLLGDPTQTLTHPEKVKLELKSGINRSEPITASITSPFSGQLNLRVDQPLGAITKGDPNQTLIYRLVKEVEANNPTEVIFRVPAEIQGPLLLRAHVESVNRVADGAAQTIIRQ